MERFEPGDFPALIGQVIDHLKASDAVLEDAAAEDRDGDRSRALTAAWQIANGLLPAIRGAAAKIAKGDLAEHRESIEQAGTDKVFDFLMGADIERTEADLRSERRRVSEETSQLKAELRAMGAPDTPSTSEEREILKQQARLPGLLARRATIANQQFEQRTRNKTVDPETYSNTKAGELQEKDAEIAECRALLRSLGIPDIGHATPVTDDDRQVMKRRTALAQACKKIDKLEAKLGSEAVRRRDRIGKLRRFAEFPEKFGAYFKQATVHLAVDITREWATQARAFAKHGAPPPRPEPPAGPVLEAKEFNEAFWKAVKRTGYPYQTTMGWVRCRFPIEIVARFDLEKTTQTKLSGEWRVGQSAISRKFQRIEAKFRIELPKALEEYLGFNPGNNIDDILAMFFPAGEDIEGGIEEEE